MLVLSRKQGQSIVVDGDITITVVAINRGRVQIGVEAPREVPVHRDEIHRRIRRDTTFVGFDSARLG